MKLYDLYISFKQRLYIFNLNYYILEYLKREKSIIIYNFNARSTTFLKANKRFKNIAEILIYFFIKLIERLEN